MIFLTIASLQYPTSSSQLAHQPSGAAIYITDTTHCVDTLFEASLAGHLLP